MTPEQVQAAKDELKTLLKDFGSELKVENANPDECRFTANAMIKEAFLNACKEASMQLTLFAAGQVPTPQEAIKIYTTILDRECAIMRETGIKMLQQHFNEAKDTHAALITDIQKNSIIVVGSCK